MTKEEVIQAKAVELKETVGKIMTWEECLLFVRTTIDEYLRKI